MVPAALRLWWWKGQAERKLPPCSSSLQLMGPQGLESDILTFPFLPVLDVTSQHSQRAAKVPVPRGALGGTHHSHCAQREGEKNRGRTGGVEMAAVGNSPICMWIKFSLPAIVGTSLWIYRVWVFLNNFFELPKPSSAKLSFCSFNHNLCLCCSLGESASCFRVLQALNHLQTERRAKMFFSFLEDGSFPTFASLAEAAGVAVYLQQDACGVGRA